MRGQGDELHEVYLLANRACLELNKGNWPDAVESAELILGRRWVSTSPRTIALTVLARIRSRRGDPNVLTLIEEARSLAEPTGELQRIAPVAIAAAEAAWLIGDAAGAREATEQALDLAVGVGAGHDIANLQAWRKRAGIIEAPHELAAEGPNRLELVGEFEAAAAAWQELGRPYEAALALADSEARPLSGARLGCSPVSTLGQPRRSSPAACAHSAHEISPAARGHRPAATQPS